MHRTKTILIGVATLSSSVLLGFTVIVIGAALISGTATF